VDAKLLIPMQPKPIIGISSPCLPNFLVFICFSFLLPKITT